MNRSSGPQVTVLFAFCCCRGYHIEPNCTKYLQGIELLFINQPLLVRKPVLKAISAQEIAAAPDRGQRLHVEGGQRWRGILPQ